jgi:hypothetical protein
MFALDGHANAPGLNDFKTRMKIIAVWIYFKDAFTLVGYHAGNSASPAAYA